MKVNEKVRQVGVWQLWFRVCRDYATLNGRMLEVALFKLTALPGMGEILTSDHILGFLFELHVRQGKVSLLVSSRDGRERVIPIIPKVSKYFIAGF